MKTYKLDSEKLPKQKRSIILLYGATFLVMLIVLYMINRNNPNSSQMLWMIPLLALLYGYMGWRAYKTRADLWNGYSLEIGDSGIIQNQPKYPELRINRNDVTTVDEKPNGLVVSTVQAQRVLGIPREFLSEADFQEVRNTLKAWEVENAARRGDEPAALDDVIDAEVEPIEAAALGTAAAAGSAVDKVEDAVSNAAEAVDTSLETAVDKLEDGLETAADKADDFAEDLKAGAEDAWENTKDGVEEAADKSGDFVEDAADAVEETAQDVKEGAANAWENVKDGAEELADDVEDKADEIKRDLEG